MGRVKEWAVDEFDGPFLEEGEGEEMEQFIQRATFFDGSNSVIVRAYFKNGLMLRFERLAKETQWNLVDGKSWLTTEKAADRVGMDPDHFWQNIEPELDKIVQAWR